jgi:hypothetical protein
MALEEQLHKFFRGVHQNHALKVLFIGIAKNVRDNYCDVEREGEPMVHDVRLHVINNAPSKFVVKPKEGSIVLCGFIESNTKLNETEAVIVQTSEVHELLLQVGTVSLKVDASGLKLDKGANNLLNVLEAVIDGNKNHIDELKNVHVAIGVTPNIPALENIKANLETQKNKLKDLLK